MGMGAFVWRCCEGKPKLTEEQARAEADRLSKKSPRRVVPYQCFVCAPNWHVGAIRKGKSGSGRKRNGG